MADKTAIEWTRGSDGTPGASWNPIRARNRATGKVGWFCTHASDGCRFCYAESFNRRLGTGIDYRAQDADKVEIFVDEKILGDPLRWRRPRKIFTLSMSDLFGEFIPDEMIDRVFTVMALTPQHTFLVLTKRAQRMRDYASSKGRPERVWDAACEIMDTLYALAKQGAEWGGEKPWPLRNVWIGISAEDQTRADERIPLLLDTPAAKRFVSLEPLLGPIDLGMLHHDGITNINALAGRHGIAQPMRGTCASLDWVIVGGESGKDARPMQPDWPRAIRDQCKAAGAAYFFKQWGEWAPGECFGLVSDGPITTRDGDVRDWMKRYVVRRDRADRLDAHSFTEHATDLVYRVGKKAAGRLLDGVEHSEFPA